MLLQYPDTNFIETQQKKKPSVPVKSKAGLEVNDMILRIRMKQRKMDINDQDSDNADKEFNRGLRNNEDW